MNQFVRSLPESLKCPKCNYRGGKGEFLTGSTLGTIVQCPKCRHTDPSDMHDELVDRHSFAPTASEEREYREAKTRPLRYDLMALAGHSTGEYSLSPEEIAETMREMADLIEDDEPLNWLYHGSLNDGMEEKDG